MPYTTEIVKPLADQLAKFVTLNRHQLAGQVANLDFWLDEVRHGLAVIDGYNNRFERLRSCKSGTSRNTGRRSSASPIHAALRVHLRRPCAAPDGPMREARHALCEATYRWLVRCYREGLITEQSVRHACRELDIGVEASDLRRHA